MNKGKFSSCVVRCLPPKKSRGWLNPFRTFLPRRVFLVEPLTWTRPDGSQYTVSPGTTSDGPSFPLFLQPFLPSRIENIEAGILHDKLCRDPEIPLQWADAEFRQALQALGNSPFIAWVCYLGLRIASPFRRGHEWSWLNLFKHGD